MTSHNATTAHASAQTPSTLVFIHGFLDGSAAWDAVKAHLDDPAPEMAVGIVILQSDGSVEIEQRLGQSGGAKVDETAICQRARVTWAQLDRLREIGRRVIQPVETQVLDTAVHERARLAGIEPKRRIVVRDRLSVPPQR